MAQAAQKSELLEDVKVKVVSDRPVVEVAISGSGQGGERLTIDEQREIKAGIPEEMDAKNKSGTVQPLHTGLWYVNLDAEGNPVGPISATPPEDPDQPYITVTNTDMVDPDELTTSSGAPLTTQMNPEHSHYDSGLEARNPRPTGPVVDSAGNVRRSPVTADAGYGQPAVDAKIKESEAEAKRKEDQRQKDRDTAAKAAKRA